MISDNRELPFSFSALLAPLLPRESLGQSVIHRRGDPEQSSIAVRCTTTITEETPYVKEAVMKAQDVQRLGLLCKCD